MSGPSDASPKGTLRYGSFAGGATGALPSLTGTIPGVASEKIAPVDLGETLFADESEPSPPSPSPHPSGTAAGPGRTTVLPRRKRGGAPLPEQRARFDRVRLLGEGAMGQVELARDNDIRRTVAVKKLHADGQSEDALLRFADEVRIVGQLEHPSIVPVYDVGKDDAGQVYLVMKHLNGETMEQVIEKLRSGDPVYRAQYSIDFRVHLFLSVLDAIRYAHARGVIHRDIKPANIMIGPYGEVTVLDWGIAKPVRRGQPAAPGAEPLERTLVDTHDSRLQETQLGSLAGTPLYMSPEQAAGRNDELDERSDVYALCVVLYEWLVLEHPLKDKKTVTEVLAATISGLDAGKASTTAIFSGVPAPWVNVIFRGLVREREGRFQSVADLEKAVRDVLDGKVKVQCHATLTRRVAYEALHWTDRHPVAFLVLFYGGAAGLILGLLYAGYRAVAG